jgi:hypothetical protein
MSAETRAVQADAPKFKMGSLPQYDSLEEERQARKERLAAGYRVFAKLGYDEGVAGHLSECLFSSSCVGLDRGDSDAFFRSLH